ncbi:hypothetical protein L3X38_009156 [Prunus dulcis]|uniref:Uncharacterized protein n=1 Tax=Prunus dulcis TaxID=3755 RepID=A0AAD4ZY06_PRUDU|nr:hypothetical protein L3X38_009156 [Prunus dulcis]
MYEDLVFKMKSIGHHKGSENPSLSFSLWSAFSEFHSVQERALSFCKFLCKVSEKEEKSLLKIFAQVERE